MKPNAKPTSKSKAGKASQTQTSNDPDSPSTTVADWEGAILKQGGVVIGHARTLPRKPQQTASKTPISDALSGIEKTGNAGPCNER
jgi:hypothetical protein